ncbi:MAG: UvrD-helicase domain-containing protein, partial [Desulfovibrionales bacterium]|nr:UvrD-helicase domain-containing protein [Desulfovibrionales bacterium]
MTRTLFDLCTAPLTGTTLIEASAGTGKTYTLSGLFLRLLVEQRIPVDQILVVTFTTAATEELRGRIRSRLAGLAQALEQDQAPDEPLEAALWQIYRHTDAQALVQAAVRSFDLAQIFTIHSFCQRMLNKNCFECQALFETTVAHSVHDLVRQTCLDFWRTHIASRTGLSGAKVRTELSPDALVRLASLPMLSQITRVEPAEPGPESAPLEKEWEEIFDQVSACWNEEQAEIRNVLYSHPGLKQNMGKPAQLDARFAVLENFLATPSLDLPDELSKLKPSYMEKIKKNGFNRPRHQFFDLIQKFCLASEALNQA